MFPTPTRPEIDHRTIKLIVGVTAISLPWLTSAFAKPGLTSISAAYYEGGWAQSILVGSLFAISAFMLAYNGRSRTEMILAKVASIAGLGVALFPCRCVDHPELVPGVHGASAAAMFLILAYFCYAFFKRARSKNHPQAKARAVVYTVCAVAILVSIALLAFYNLSHSFQERFPTFAFWGEAAGLTAFGISWLTASRVLPGLTREDERFSPLREHNPS